MDDLGRLCLKDFSTDLVGIQLWDDTHSPRPPANFQSYCSVRCHSGYLVLADAFDLLFPPPDLGQASLKPFRPGVFAQTELSVYFSNHWGDGVFGVYSKGGEIIIPINEPNLVTFLEEVARKEDRNVDGFGVLEGAVGVGGGVMAVSDPVINPPRSLFGPKEDLFKKGSYFTILKVDKGLYNCIFDDERPRVMLYKNDEKT